MKKLKTQKGITLIALVITIIVMLILIAVTISMAINGGLFEKAGQATKDTKNAMDAEQTLASGQITIDGKTYASIDDYLAGKEMTTGSNAEWDKNATDEKYFTWGSDDPENGLYYRLLGINEEYASELPENIVLPSRCMDIYHDAFYASTRIYGETAVNALTNIKSVKVPNTVVSIGARAFCDCTSLETMEIPDSVACIGYLAFSETAWYSKQEDGVIIVGKVVYAYKGSSTTNVTVEIPEGIVYVTDHAFDVGGEITENGFTSITLPNSLKAIGKYAFRNCAGVTRLTIPEGITKIDDGVFQGWAGLTSVTIPEGVTYIGMYTFKTCTGLTNITIPSSVTYIVSDAFSEIPSNAVFNVVAGSYAETWAKNKGYNVQYTQ